DRTVNLRSPISGYVLRIVEKSDRVLAPGSPVLIIGDQAKLEVVVDVLSTEAVKVRPGAEMLLDGWGGDHTIRACVRTVEPEAFTKVSALGIEEQRVNIVGDFVDPVDRLGDGYRVEARIIVWQSSNVLEIPSSALFRHGLEWSVFVLESGHARRRPVQVGHRNPLQAEILGGIKEGDRVVLHPTNQLDDGSRIEVR
ncbi:MAG TPA: HlyD family efflux transporter periplasmic adaptor subunit, partial [Blastocatellia bacterium]|nr:HlyD family efflux transporter periplasmic adaptor subunit [Blastocatellia bacterium]